MLTGLKNYFSFNKRERNGIFVLLIILILVILIPKFLRFFTPSEMNDFVDFKNDVALFEKNLKNKKDSSSFTNFDYNNIDKSVAENKLTPFLFNPNNLSEEKWKALGFDNKQIKTIKKFEAKGGRFYKKEDLKKIYGISQSEYEILAPFIQLDEKKNDFSKKENTHFSNTKNAIIVELNSSDTANLKTLKGIGSGYAKRIIAYRNKLGGFIKKEQLLEVYGMDSVRYSGIVDYISINTTLITKININTADLNILKSHPYIGYNIANSLTNMRKLHGNFKTLSDIKKSALITDKIYTKILPYLTVE